jgi:hypothetical protein
VGRGGHWSGTTSPFSTITRQKANAQPSVFKPDRSLQYVLDEDGATAAYDNPAMATIERDLLIEGIAGAR